MTVAAVTTQLTAIATAIIAARVLQEVGFGELGMVRSTILVFSVLAGTSLGVSCTKYVAEFRDKDPARAGRIVGLMLNVGLICGIIGTILCLVFASPLAVLAVKAEQLTGALRIGCLLVGLNILIGAELGALNGLEAFHSAMLIRCFRGLITLVLVSLGVCISGVNGAISGYVAASLCTLPIVHIMLKRRCEQAGIAVRHRHVLSDMPILWRFSIPAVLAGISTQSFEWLAKVLLSRQPDGMAQVGFITAALALAGFVQFLPQQFAAPMMPILSHVYAAGQRGSFRRAIQKGSLLLIVVGIVVAIPMVLLARHLMTTYGGSFVVGAPALVIIALTYGLVSATMVSTAALAATGRMWTQTAHKLAWGTTMVFAMYWLAEYGALGMAYSYAIANVTYGTLQFITVARLVRGMQNEAKPDAVSQVGLMTQAAPSGQLVAK